MRLSDDPDDGDKKQAPSSPEGQHANRPSDPKLQDTGDNTGLIGIDLTLCPKSWLPEALNTVTFTAKIYTCVSGRGWVFPGPPRKITFKLSNVSNEKGICLNKGKSLNPDLWFPRQDGVKSEKETDGTVDPLCEEIILTHVNPNHKHFQSATTLKPVTEFTITVRSEDYGAWGYLEATADGCVSIPPREDKSMPVACLRGICCKRPNNEVAIPRDDNGNHIADSAAQDDAGAAPNKDEDDKPKNDHKGDGLSNYEEYRGVMILKENSRTEERHKRTNITEKDLFVWDRDNLGKGDFGASEVQVWFVRQDHLGGNSGKEINFNRGYATNGAQCGLQLKNQGLQGELGWTPGGPGTPHSINEVLIDRVKNTSVAQLNSTIAHELGHGVNVPHHGRQNMVPGPGAVEYAHGVVSGDVGCVMRYTDTARWWLWTDSVPHKKYEIRWPEPMPSAFCNSKLGTGPNVSTDGLNRNNSATEGDCKKHIQVKDN